MSDGKPQFSYTAGGNEKQHNHDRIWKKGHLPSDLAILISGIHPKIHW